MDPDYVDPNTFDLELVNAVDDWLSAANPVIEVGASVGVLQPYINDDRLALPGMHVSLEPNLYLLPSL